MYELCEAPIRPSSPKWEYMHCISIYILGKLTFSMDMDSKASALMLLLDLKLLKFFTLLEFLSSLIKISFTYFRLCSLNIFVDCILICSTEGARSQNWNFWSLSLPGICTLLLCCSHNCLHCSSWIKSEVSNYALELRFGTNSDVGSKGCHPERIGSLAITGSRRSFSTYLISIYLVLEDLLKLNRLIRFWMLLLYWF